MMLRYRQYSGLPIGDYLPFIESAIPFFDEHYRWQHFVNAIRPLDENGHLVLFRPPHAKPTRARSIRPTWWRG